MHELRIFAYTVHMFVEFRAVLEFHGDISRKKKNWPSDYFYKFRKIQFVSTSIAVWCIPSSKAGFLSALVVLS